MLLRGWNSRLAWRVASVQQLCQQPAQLQALDSSQHRSRHLMCTKARSWALELNAMLEALAERSDCAGRTRSSQDGG